MLHSPEEELLAKAGESLYRFAEKCDENKQQLLEAGALPPLIDLLAHEDRIARRNALMALAVTASEPGVRRTLKKQPDTVSAVVALLNPDEAEVVHEFACLYLASLAQDFSSKINIMQHDAMEPLIRCLSSTDPDVQKNAVE